MQALTPDFCLQIKSHRSKMQNQSYVVLAWAVVIVLSSPLLSASVASSENKEAALVEWVESLGGKVRRWNSIAVKYAVY